MLYIFNPVVWNGILDHEESRYPENSSVRDVVLSQSTKYIMGGQNNQSRSFKKNGETSGTHEDYQEQKAAVLRTCDAWRKVWTVTTNNRRQNLWKERQRKKKNKLVAEFEGVV
uniref:Uncharacterized protein n=1 Tax=Cacopsylla melanoneura TaxID=428564 RepID=A0A8D8SGE4_9HEMI